MACSSFLQPLIQPSIASNASMSKRSLSFCMKPYGLPVMTKVGLSALSNAPLVTFRPALTEMGLIADSFLQAKPADQHIYFAYFDFDASVQKVFQKVRERVQNIHGQRICHLSLSSRFLLGTLLGERRSPKGCRVDIKFLVSYMLKPNVQLTVIMCSMRLRMRRFCGTSRPRAS